MNNPCVKCGSTVRHLRSGRPSGCANCGKQRYLNAKKIVMEQYGGVCYCCGESELGFLTIDHSFQDGAKHKRERGRGAKNFYYWLRRNGYPKNLGLRVACANCNTATMFGRICPHKIG